LLPVDLAGRGQGVEEEKAGMVRVDPIPLDSDATSPWPIAWELLPARGAPSSSEHLELYNDLAKTLRKIGNGYDGAVDAEEWLTILSAIDRIYLLKAKLASMKGSRVNAIVPCSPTEPTLSDCAAELEDDVLHELNVPVQGRLLRKTVWYATATEHAVRLELHPRPGFATWLRETASKSSLELEDQERRDEDVKHSGEEIKSMLYQTTNGVVGALSRIFTKAEATSASPDLDASPHQTRRFSSFRGMVRRKSGSSKRKTRNSTASQNRSVRKGSVNSQGAQTDGVRSANTKTSSASGRVKTPMAKLVTSSKKP